MADLSVKYAGLRLKNPIVAAGGTPTRTIYSMNKLIEVFQILVQHAYSLQSLIVLKIKGFNNLTTKLPIHLFFKNLCFRKFNTHLLTPF